MTSKDKQNLHYVVKGLREAASDMLDCMEHYECNSPACRVALSARDSFIHAYMMILCVEKFGSCDWKQFQDEISVPPDCRFIKNGKLN